MRQRLSYIAAIIGLFVSVRAAGQTTQPAPAVWNDTVQSLVSALISEDGSATVASLISETIPIREFSGTQNESRYHLQQRTEGLVAISIRTYAWPADTIASDLAADVKAFEQLPAALRGQFLPRDAADARKANVIAQQWISSRLDTSVGDLVAVVLLTEPVPPVTVSSLISAIPSPDPKPPLFLLIKGRLNENGEVLITHLAFGDARQAVK